MSVLSGFYRLSLRDRRAKIAAIVGATEDEVARLSPARGLAEAEADRMIENAVGVLGVPLGVCVNLRVDDRDVLVPMAVEEPSVIAASSYAAKLLRAGGGVRSEATAPVMIGQIQVMDVADPAGAARAVLEAREELLTLANREHASLVAAGGGARDVETRHLPPLDEDDPCGPMLIVHLVVDVRDAMGANAINSMCERLAPRVAELTGGRVGLRILSNLTDRRTVLVEGRVPFSALDGQGAESGEILARRIEEASVFAERCPWRAATHNKGIMNGVDAVLLALGQDWRAVEAGAHAFVAQDGRYGAMARWRVAESALVGRMRIPMAVGTVGGVIRAHPVVQINRRIARIEQAKDLAAITAAAGLAQNLGALRALAAEGIQSGHMRLHARKVVVTDASDTVRAASTEKSPSREHHAITSPTPRPPTPPVDREDGPMMESADESRPRYQPRPHRDFGGKVFVTGAAGHLGANLVRKLVAEGRDVRVLLREGSNNAAIEGLSVERVYGDLRDGKRLGQWMRGCSIGFHCAALISTTNATPEAEREIFDCNVIGTRNLLRAAMDAHYERVVITGSFSAVGYDPADPKRPADEDDIFYPFDEVLPYGRTKVQVEHEVLKAVAEGLDALVATSCAIVGPHDHKPSRMGRTLLDFAHGKLNAYPTGGFEFVSASDVTEGHVLAMHRGRRGQRYILSTEYSTVDGLMDTFEEVSGRRRPRLRIPGPIMSGIAAASSLVLDTFAPHASRRFTPAAVRFLRSERRADTTKARIELGYQPTSIRHAIHEAYADFARRGLVPSRRGTAAFEDRRREDPRVAEPTRRAKAG